MHVEQDDLDRIVPVAVGAALIGLGLALWRSEPKFLALPDSTPVPDISNPGTLVSAAQDARDQIARIMPANLATTLSRSLLITGAVMIAVRALDEFTSRSR